MAFKRRTDQKFHPTGLVCTAKDTCFPILWDGPRNYLFSVFRLVPKQQSILTADGIEKTSKRQQK